MKRTASLILAAALFAALTLFAAPAEAQTRIVVSVPPLKYMVERIGGDRVQTSVMVLPGANPATYEPKPRQMSALGEADAFVRIGVPFEYSWLPRFRDLNPDMRIIDAQKGIDLVSIEKHSRIIHDEDGVPDPAEDAGVEADHEGEEDGHDHRGFADPHTWVSPPLVLTMIDTITAELAAMDPAGEDYFSARAAGFRKDVNELHRFLTGYFARYAGRPFLTFHPSWGYFADAYGLVQVSAEIDGSEPKPADLAAVIDFAKENRIRVIFAQPQFSARSANAIARSLGGFVIEADPLAENWLDNMYDVADKFRAAVQ